MTNVHINTHGVQQLPAALQRNETMCTCPLKKKKQDTQTACIIAHQLTLQPFIVPGKMHARTNTRMLTRTHRLPRPALLTLRRSVSG